MCTISNIPSPNVHSLSASSIKNCTFGGVLLDLVHKKSWHTRGLVVQTRLNGTQVCSNDFRSRISSASRVWSTPTRDLLQAVKRAPSLCNINGPNTGPCPDIQNLLWVRNYRSHVQFTLEQKKIYMMNYIQSVLFSLVIGYSIYSMQWGQLPPYTLGMNTPPYPSLYP